MRLAGVNGILQVKTTDAVLESKEVSEEIQKMTYRLHASPELLVHHSAVVCLSTGAGNFFNKRAILLHFPPDTTGEESQNVDNVLFFMRLHMDII